MKKKAKPRKSGRAKKSRVKDLEPRANPKGGASVDYFRVGADGSVLPAVQLPASLKVTTHK